MKYAVTWVQDFESGKGETCGFFYAEDDTYVLPYTNAKNKEDAARKYLAQKYDEEDYCAEYMDYHMMEKFIRYSVDGEKTLNRYARQEEIDALIQEIDDYFVECLMKDGLINIRIERDEYSYTTPSDDEKYIKKVAEKFEPECLLSLLTEEEKKEVFIEVNLGELFVIPLEAF